MEISLQKVESNQINKILVVGHPLSGYEELEKLLNSCGMNRPRPSRQDGFLPEQISTTLCKAHKIPTVDPLRLNAEIEQIKVGPIWNGVALNLLLGNIDQELWGWADPQAVYLLDYWIALDPQLAFILVYNTPQQLIACAFDGDKPLSSETLQQVTKNWATYNAALLHFYHRNPGRCLLVNVQQVRASTSTYLHQVRMDLGAPVKTENAHTEYDKNSSPRTKEAEASPLCSLKTFIAQTLIDQQPAILELYEELQSVANLPLSDDLNTLSGQEAWMSFIAVQAQYKENLAQSLAAQQKVRKLQQQKENLEHEKDSLARLAANRGKQLEELELQVGELQTRLTKQTSVSLANSELEQENNLLLRQLHQVQEELEHYYLLSQKRATNSALPVQAAKPLSQSHLGAAERVKRRLSYRLGATMVAHSRSFRGYLTMPWALLKEAQEFEREKRARGDVHLPPIKHYADAYEAERIKQHLSYRLGSVLVANGGSALGWLKMPGALRREVLSFKRSRAR